MKLKFYLGIAQVILCFILSFLILLQARGTGLSSSFGSLYRSKRGLERAFFIGTVALSVLFVVNSTLIVITE